MKLTYSQLEWHTPTPNPEALADYPAPPPFFGQGRAREALEAAVRGGFHAYLIGPSNVGKHQTLIGYLQSLGGKRPNDLLYLPLSERHAGPLELPAGQGVVFLRAAEGFLDEGKNLDKLFRQAPFLQDKHRLEAAIIEKQQQLVAELSKRGKALGFELVSSEQGLSFGDAAIPAELKAKLEETALAYVALESEIELDLAGLRRKWAENYLEARLGKLAKDYSEARLYLEALFHRMLRYAETLQTFDHEPWLPHLLINRLDQPDPPVVYEPLPNPVRLFGQLEYRSTGGSLSTNVSLIRPGALHKAHDGYLILEAHVLLTQGAWEGLKRALRTGVVELHNPGGDTPIQGLQTEGAPVHTQVFLIGPPEVFQALENDTEFVELFRYRIEFSPFLPHKPETRQQLGGWLASRGLKLTEGALSVLYDHSRRLIGERERGDARLLELLAIAQEASKLSGQPVKAEGMSRTIQGREDRASLADDEFMDGVLEGTWVFDVKGQAVGQINSLVVLETDPPWGRPVRVTARVAPGREGVLSIDREAGLGGQIFHKAVLTLAGFMRGHYARLGPLSAAISLVFEQNYANIEGDSAGLAELMAALSAIGDFPLRQDLGLTGAIDQTGKVLAIGGAGPKAEGFYRVCKALGLTGNQGVVVPLSNLQNLTLSAEMMQAIKEERFHIYAVETVEQALELFSGKPASKVHTLVEKRLLEFKELENGDDKEDK